MVISELNNAEVVLVLNVFTNDAEKKMHENASLGDREKIPFNRLETIEAVYKSLQHRVKAGITHTMITADNVRYTLNSSI